MANKTMISSASEGFYTHTHTHSAIFRSAEVNYQLNKRRLDIEALNAKRRATIITLLFFFFFSCHIILSLSVVDHRWIYANFKS